MYSRAVTWWTILRIALAERLVYRGDFALGTLMRFLPIITQIFLWYAIFQARGNEPGEMRHVDHQIGADGIGDGAETREIDDARIGGAAGDDQGRLMLLGQPLDLVIVDAMIVLAHAVLHGIEPFP